MRSEYEYAIIELEELIVSVEEGVGSVRLADAARLAVEALRKQEQVKPQACHVAPMYNGWHYQGQVRTKALVHYCPNCGQKLDWKEVE